MYNGIDIGSNNRSDKEGNDVKLRFDLTKLKDIPNVAGGVRVGSYQYSQGKANKIDFSEFNDTAPAPPPPPPPPSRPRGFGIGIGAWY